MNGVITNRFMGISSSQNKIDTSILIRYWYKFYLLAVPALTEAAQHVSQQLCIVF